MINYTSHNDVDRKKWDALVERSTHGSPYGLSWYLDEVSPYWHALVEDDYRAVMPLTARRKYGVDYLFPPFYAQQLGMFAEESTAKKLNEFLEAIPVNYKFIEINVNSGNSYEGNDFTVTPNANYLLDLNQPYEELVKGYNENTRRNVKKAAKQELVMKTNETITEEVIALFRKDRGAQFPNLKDEYYHLLQHVISAASAQGMGMVFGVYATDGKLLAGATFVITGKRAVFLFSGNSDRGRETRAMHYLFDRVIENYSGKNIVLDYEGSNDPNLARFYQGFGAKEEIYLRLRKNKLPWYVKWLKR